MKDLLDFIDSQTAWFPLYAFLSLFLLVECISCWIKLKNARKEIKVLKLQKELLFEEQAELKQIIKTNHLN